MVLRFFKRVGRPKPVLVVLVILLAVNACLYFFVYQDRLAAPSDDRSPAQSAAPPGELTRNERHVAPKLLVGLPVGPSARSPETPTFKAEEGAEVPREETRASAREENAGQPGHTTAKSSQPAADSRTAVTVGSLSTASAAASASSASSAQYYAAPATSASGAQ